jgi:outer membrane protein
MVAGAALSLAADGPQRLTLREAEGMAIAHHPQVRAAALTAGAAAEVPTEYRAAYFPAVTANLTGAGAINNSRIAAGALNNPLVYDRFASGITISQMITDLGRTSNLVASARLHAKAEQSLSQATRDQVVLEVDRTFYTLLRAQALLRVARETVEARQLVADQVRTLAESKLKSNLDVSFANVNLSEARLLLANARSGVEAARTEFATALGDASPRAFDLVEEPLAGAVPEDGDGLVKQALGARPELAGLRAEAEAAARFAQAERALQYPTVSALATSGYTPVAQSPLQDRWAAAGVNISIPLFNGKLYSARHREAQYKAEAAVQKVRDLENRVARDVRVAWLDARTAYERLDLTRQLLEQARMAYDLAQGRYELGLGSIVELSQAQLNRTSAEIAGVSAGYEYRLQRTVLDYQEGVTR